MSDSQGISHMRVLGVLIICIAVCLSGCFGGRMTFAEGIRCFQVQDYRQAFIHLMPAAKAGNPDAQYAIGYMYYYGQGVLENRTKAWYWIKCAAEAGQIDAIHVMETVKHVDNPEGFTPVQFK